MDVDSMRNPTRRREIRAAWEDGWQMSPDLVIAWEMAWDGLDGKYTKEGDASSKYFFNYLKSKQKQERITSLSNDNGQIVEDEDRMLLMRHDYYQKLYSQQPEEVGDDEERRVVLG
ncbi:hypothetical protein R1sor_010753 [Riccia sorocarpa]|uniref:Uncharacterized protein n=1 Tax=Riccia sorocarpa TaxID=122646 RepID=A0ABD3HYY7_9MARC